MANLVCPSCSADYMIDDAMLGPKGRKVRCATCSHVWRAMRPDKEESEEATAFDGFAAISAEETMDETATTADDGSSSSVDDGFDPVDPTPSQTLSQTAQAARDGASGFIAAIEENVRRPIAQKAAEDEADLATAIPSGPVGVESPEQRLARRKGFGRVRLKRLRSGPSIVSVWLGKAAKIAVPASVAAGLIAVGLAIPYRNAVVRAVPDLASLYALVGLDVNIRGVVFSQFEAERSMVAGLPVLRIDGTMMNVKSHPVALAPLRLALLDQGAQELFVWRVDPQQETLEPGGVLPVASELTAPPANIDSIAVRFLQEGERLPGQMQ